MEVHVICDLQWGSCAKRLFTEYYADLWKPDIIITNGMPNSGGYDSEGVKWSALPIGHPCDIMIAPGAVINEKDLHREMGNLPREAKVYIHQNAGVVSEQDLEAEEKYLRIGSTMTGGAAVTKRKMDRNPDDLVVARDFFEHTMNNMGWLRKLASAKRVLVLCAQGHGLSINFGFYPYTTSRNTSPAQSIADAGIAPQHVKKIIGCCRPYPIRVSNRFDKDGNMVGFSGPCYDDQKEITWDTIGVPEEITSVSKKVRRVFSFSPTQLIEAVAITGTTNLFLGFLNYMPTDTQETFVHDLSRICPVSWVGLNKTINDILPVEDYKWGRSWI